MVYVSRMRLNLAAIGLLLVACHTATTAGVDLQSLIPVPANTVKTDGPEAILDHGIHLHFLVNGSPLDVLAAYKAAIQAKSWSVIAESSSGKGGSGIATYTASNGAAFGTFTGGGMGSWADVDACAWPSKPANASCGHGGG